MGGVFTPFKRSANKFKYTPRYYDPAKEEREERREQMYGTRRDSGSIRYQPGQYIRSKRAARVASKPKKGGRIWLMVVAIAAVTYLGAILYDKLIEVFGLTENSTPKIEQRILEHEEFDPTIPITIVPNDYDPTKEE